MNRRLAKKRHVGMYKQVGFDIEGKFLPGVTEEGRDKFHDDLCEFVDKLGITFGGGWSPGNFGFCFHSPKRFQSTTEHHLREVKSWLIQRPEVVEFKIQENVDLWREPLNEEAP